MSESVSKRELFQNEFGESTMSNIELINISSEPSSSGKFIHELTFSITLVADCGLDTIAIYGPINPIPAKSSKDTDKNNRISLGKRLLSGPSNTRISFKYLRINYCFLLT